MDKPLNRKVVYGSEPSEAFTKSKSLLFSFSIGSFGFLLLPGLIAVIALVGYGLLSLFASIAPFAQEPTAEELPIRYSLVADGSELRELIRTDDATREKVVDLLKSYSFDALGPKKVIPADHDVFVREYGDDFTLTIYMIKKDHGGEILVNPVKPDALLAPMSVLEARFPSEVVQEHDEQYSNAFKDLKRLREDIEKLALG